MIYDGQRLDGVCPWCGQGPRTLVVRIPDEPEDPAEPPAPMLVVCEGYGRICEPPESDCGLYVRGRPAWPWTEWDWLAQRIAHHEAIQPAYLLPCWLWQGARADVPGPSHGRSCGRWDCVRPEHIVREREAAYG